MNTKTFIQRLRVAALSLTVALSAIELRGSEANPLTKADLESIASEAVRNKLLSGVAFGVIQASQTTEYYGGELSADQPTAPDTATVFEIGSVTKTFTALLLADAVVRGDLELDTAIARYLPQGISLPDQAEQLITLRMLATHTSGLPRIPAEIPPTDFRDPYSSFSDADLWDSLTRVKLDFAPGTRASYSNLAAGLLGAILARNANLSYAELLDERILSPLGMKQTSVAVPGSDHAKLAPPTNAFGAVVQPWTFSVLAGAGGIRSTLPDMIRFADAMLHPDSTPLGPAIELMWQKQDLAATVSPGGQCLGWLVAGDGETRWHNGMTAGFHSAVFINRARGVASIFLTNRSAPIGTQLADTAIRRALGIAAPAAAFRDRPEVEVDPAALDRYVGTYRINQQFALVIERRHDALFVTPIGQASDRLYAASPTTFFSRKIAAEIVFETSDSEPAPALTLRQNGREARARRE